MQTILNKCIENSYNDYGLVANVSNIYYCTDNEAYENKNVDLGDFIFGAIIILLLVINGVATFYDVILRKWTQTNKESGNQYLLTFSVIQNWERLIQSGHIDPAYERFASVHGVRSLSSFLTILPHMMLLVGSGFVDNPHDFEKAYYNPFFYIIVNGTMFVQIYFIVSGSLMTYSLALNDGKRKEKWGFFFKAILYRWIRLVPSVALLLGFITTWYRHLGSGPLWEFYTTPVVNDCRRYWWSHILLFNNYIEDNKYCLLQSWQIAADYQMYSIALALYLGTKKGRGRSLAHFLLFAIGCIAPALHVWFQNLDGVFILYPEIYRTFKTDNFRKMHVFFYNNLACFAMGLQLDSSVPRGGVVIISDGNPNLHLGGDAGNQDFEAMSF
ncbi:unnamed protein product [Leptosia nina]|uniref:Acyltransferase 3 domain-containing protein n=1 Tax=Leptosia nina TaxID=320188 RepID=A0AAV1JMV6_9NEOP